VANFVPGQEATLYGSKLSSVTSLAVGGVVVTPRPVSDTTLAFSVPVFGPCETDGRLVEVKANGSVAVRAALQVPNTVRMEVGESHVLSREELSCIALRAADEDYVLTALNPSLDAEERLDALLTVHTRTGAGTALSAPSRGVAPTENPAGSWDRHVAQEQALLAGTTARSAVSSAIPVPFDPRYATAKVGDTVRFVDWAIPGVRAGGIRADFTGCRTARDAAPSYPVAVVAVSGKTVIGVDLRMPNAQELLSESSRAWSDQIARIVDPVMIPAMREVFDREYEPLQGAGGRIFHILTKLEGAGGLSGDGGTGLHQSDCALASEVSVGLYDGTVFPKTIAGARLLASVMIHEYSHIADGLTQLRMKGSPGSGFLTEPWACVAQETAARIASRQSTRARVSLLTDNHPDPDRGPGTVWGTGPAAGSPWGVSGRYDQGTTFLVYARERAGDAVLGAVTGITLRQRLYARDHDWRVAASTLRALAAELGTTPEELLDAAALASATDDLLPPEVADARRLPQLKTWDNSDRAQSQGPRHTSFATRVGRTADASRTMAAVPGSYAALYLFADAGRGVSLEFSNLSPRPFVARLTRVR
jgi:hypothetical protein